MSFNPNIRIGEVTSNDELREIFKCGNMGGMRKSNSTNTLVIISDHTKGLYEDKWFGDTIHYTGMGKKGPQSLTFSQNRTLAESDSNGIDVHLFEVLKEKDYIYKGQVQLCGEPYEEIQKDEDGIPRSVWIFPLKLKDSNNPSQFTDLKVIQESFEKKLKEASRRDDNTIKERAIENGSKKVSVRRTVSSTYERNPYVTEYAKRRAKGICQLCQNPAPFKDNKGKPYLETHHIDWLSRGGADTIENTVALCPNCHKRMHVLDLESDRNGLKVRAKL